jgi:Protein of unknown function (DUF2637)
MGCRSLPGGQPSRAASSAELARLDVLPARAWKAVTVARSGRYRRSRLHEDIVKLRDSDFILPLLQPYAAIRLSTAAAVLAVAGIAAYISYWHAYAVVRAHGETGMIARLQPATIDGLVYASSMVVLYAARHRVPASCLARWLLGLGIAATLRANVAQGATTTVRDRSRPRKWPASSRSACR